MVPMMNMGYWAHGAEHAANPCRQSQTDLFALVASQASADLLSGRVLDAGCGIGLNAFYLAEKYSSERVIGLNISPDNLRVAHVRSQQWRILRNANLLYLLMAFPFLYYPWDYILISASVPS